MIRSLIHLIQNRAKTQGLPNGRITPCAPGAALCAIRMNKIPAFASKYRGSNTLYRGTQCRPKDYAAQNVTPNSAILGIPVMSGFAAPVVSFLEYWLKSFKPSKAAIESDNSHNPGFLYLTHTLFGVMYMLSEVIQRPLGGTKSAFLGTIPLLSTLTPHKKNFTLDCIFVKNGESL